MKKLFLTTLLIGNVAFAEMNCVGASPCPTLKGLLVLIVLCLNVATAGIGFLYTADKELIGNDLKKMLIITVIADILCLLLMFF